MISKFLGNCQPLNRELKQYSTASHSICLIIYRVDVYSYKQDSLSERNLKKSQAAQNYLKKDQTLIIFSNSIL